VDEKHYIHCKICQNRVKYDYLLDKSKELCGDCYSRIDPERLKDNPLRWSRYILPCGSEVYLTQRPDVADPMTIGEFVREKKPDVRFCFTDDIVPNRFPYGGVPFHWLPWVPGRDIPIENVFAFICMMRYYLEREDSFWLHCDSSSMRAPTYFGLFLHAMYPDKVQEICEAMVVHPESYTAYATHSRADKYASIEMDTERDDGIKGLIKAWQDGGETEAHKFYMNWKCKF